MVNLFDILINDILSVFVDVSVLSEPIGIAGWSLSYLDIFKTFFVVIVSYIVVWLFLILPFRLLQCLMNWKSIKGGKR